jgi:[amino group carrier protein]-6-phospho-L-2-aminoadipate/5-phospho-L-glutamate reductase
MTAPLPVFLAGASGLLAGEFLRLLESHPNLNLATAYSRSEGQNLAELQPHLALTGETRHTKALAELADDLLYALSKSPKIILVLALPHGQSATWWAQYREKFAAWPSHLIVVDLSADFRLQDAGSYQTTYGATHPCADELGRWNYGLPELHPINPAILRIAVPGCFATAMQLAVMPAAREKILSTEGCWVMHGVTGSSGSGAHPSATTHHPHRAGNFRAYSLHGHRHEAELAAPRNFARCPPVDFTPHSGSFSRGIHLHAVLPLRLALTEAELRQLYRNHYQDQAFVAVTDLSPEIRQVTGSNRALIGISTRAQQLHVVCVLDNTMKGGAGQAMQCLNELLAIPVQTALPTSGLGY